MLPLTIGELGCFLCHQSFELFGLFSLLSCTLCLDHLLLVVELTEASLDQVRRRIGFRRWLDRHWRHQVESL